MKMRLFLAITLFLSVVMVSACGEVAQTATLAATATLQKEEEKAILGVNVPVDCLSKPGAGYRVIQSLPGGGFYEILGTDLGTVSIDDDIAWFQVNPAALVDPSPPHRPLDETGINSALRCWLPRGSVQVKGDLSRLPIIEKPVVSVRSGTVCRGGPGEGFIEVRTFDIGLTFDILAIDDDVKWIDNDITWVWINPHAIVDPNPPHRPLNELAPQPDPPGSQMVPRCWVPAEEGDTGGDLSQLPVIKKPFLEVIETTDCRSGPGKGYGVTRKLDMGAFFGITGIDDDVAWIDDDDVTWIDDDIAWFQVNPAALVDPLPPHHPLDETAINSALRCWLPRGSVRWSGDLSRVPVFDLPSVPPSQQPKPQPTPKQPTQPPAVNCSAYTTYITCMQNSNFGCVWDANKQVCFKQ